MDNDDLKGLPLFAWQPPRKVILFPIGMQRGHVRRIASTLLEKHGTEAEIYWRQVITSNRAHLDHVGLSEDEQNVQLQALFDAVQEEITSSAISRSDGSAH